MVQLSLKRETMGSQIAALLRRAILEGEFAPGEHLIETALALRLGASRGPLREAMRQLIEEGLLVSVPYTGTRVVELSLQDVNDIYAMRACLEQFAFELAWPRRNNAFSEELRRRNDALQAAIDAADDPRAIEAELDLHGLVYEWAGNGLLLASWHSIRGRLQLYWAAHHRAHGLTGPLRESHDDYLRLATGADLDAMKNEIRNHMQRGLDRTKAFVEAQGALQG
ncbi:GntR family transcriptional regulator [Halodurantibacterium flavum]|uniref:GntR family transcriptional regulator n=1 Tax=Halodurantibacterium flavum TaxID=1382802 RepID=A0ABW4S1R0_9RHOB